MVTARVKAQLEAVGEAIGFVLGLHSCSWQPSRLAS